MAFNFVSQCSALVPPGGPTRMIGAYDEDSSKWTELPPCIAGKASSLGSHERVELTPLEISRYYYAPLHALSDIVLVEALCRSRAIFSLTLDGNNSFHVDPQQDLQNIPCFRVDNSPSGRYRLYAVSIFKPSCCLSARLPVG